MVLSIDIGPPKIYTPLSIIQSCSGDTACTCGGHKSISDQENISKSELCPSWAGVVETGPFPLPQLRMKSSKALDGREPEDKV